MDLGRPFVGAAATAAGLVTAKQLRGPGFRTLFRGVHIAAGIEVTYLLRCEAAALAAGCLLLSPHPGAALVGRPAPDGIVPVGGWVTPGAPMPAAALAGWSAAETLGADCAPDGVPVEILVPGGHRRRRPGLVVHRGGVGPGEIVTDVRIPVPDRSRRRRFVPGRTVTTTSAVRTALDLARREARIEAVIALDALARVGAFPPRAVLDLATAHPGLRGIARLPGLVGLSSPLAESPMETRVRLALHDGGLPPPVLQHPVGEYRIDLAYPEVLLGIEYDGEYHRSAERAREDLARQAFLAVRGWRILRPDAFRTRHRPNEIADHVRYHLVERDVSAPTRART